jgi:hypothetical protein
MEVFLFLLKEAGIFIDKIVGLVKLIQISSAKGTEADVNVHHLDITEVVPGRKVKPEQVGFVQPAFGTILYYPEIHTGLSWGIVPDAQPGATKILH